METLEQLRLHITRFLIYVVALQILNMGLFVQEFEPLVSSAVTPEINIINTVDEYIAEVLLHHKDAVPEVKQHSKKDLQLHKHSLIKLINVTRPAVEYSTKLSPSMSLSGFLDSYYYQFCKDINPPPPKSLA